jgi:uncharacterized protein YjbI with pentapeptide repeats
LFGLLIYRWMWGGFGTRVRSMTETFEYDLAETSDRSPEFAGEKPVKKTIAQEMEKRKNLLDWIVILLAPLAAATVATVALLGAQQENLRAQDARVQEYLDAASTVLLNEQLRNAPGDQAESRVSAYLTGRTLTTLQSLDAERKGMILQFLQQSQLINKERPIVHLDGADLSEADMSNMDLSGTDLAGSILTNADLTGADLSNAKLTDADLRGANLTDARVTEEQLREAHSLQGATMPDGSERP